MTSEGWVYTLVRQESLNGLRTFRFLLHLLRVVVEITRAWVWLEALPG